MDPTELDPPVLKEYPLTHQLNGWIDNGQPGPARVIYSQKGGIYTFRGVIGHDAKRGGRGHENEHYLATHTIHEERWWVWGWVNCSDVFDIEVCRKTLLPPTAQFIHPSSEKYHLRPLRR